MGLAGGGVDWHPAPETEETNYIEAEAEAARGGGPGPGAQTPDASASDNADTDQLISREQMSRDSAGVHVWTCSEV